MSYEPGILRAATARMRARSERHARDIYELRLRLYRDEPRLAQMDADLRGTMAEVAELALSRDPDHAKKLEEIKSRNLALQGARAVVLRAMGYSPDALDDAPVCPRCRDTGRVDGQMCQCLRSLCIEEQMRSLSGKLPVNEQTFDAFRLDVYTDRQWEGETRSPREQMERIVSLCEEYAHQFGEFPLKNLFFSGATGLGKTFLSACIAREVVRAGFSVVYDTAINIFATFEARKFAREADQEREARDDARRYLNCDLLILDDLGSEMMTQFVQATLYELINSRLTAGKRTIISSNLSVEEVRRRYSPQIASRIEGEYSELTFYGEDIRLMRKN